MHATEVCRCWDVQALSGFQGTSCSSGVGISPAQAPRHRLDYPSVSSVTFDTKVVVKKPNAANVVFFARLAGSAHDSKWWH